MAGRRPVGADARRLDPRMTRLAGAQNGAMTIELGLDTFGDVSVDDDGRPVPYPQVIRDIVEQGALADAVGVEHFSLGEHHRDDFAVSAPDMVLAAIASRTSRITLGTAVTVLSSDD